MDRMNLFLFYFSFNSKIKNFHLHSSLTEHLHFSFVNYFYLTFLKVLEILRRLLILYHFQQQMYHCVQREKKG